MTISQYYRCAAWLPIAVPLMALPIFLVDHGCDLSQLTLAPEHYTASVVATFLVASLLWGGMPYLLTLALAYKPLQGKGTRAQRLFALTLPLCQLPVLFAAVFLLVLWEKMRYVDLKGDSPFDSIGVFLIYFGVSGALTLGLGYLYVLLTQVTLWLLQRCQIVEPWNPVTPPHLVPELRTPVSRFAPRTGGEV